MPLTPEQRAAYGPDWPDVRAAIGERSGGRCECKGECGWKRHPAPAGSLRGDDRARCHARNGQPHPFTGSRVVLTVAHLDHNPGTNDPDRLRHMCQGCHLSYDRANRTRTPTGSA
jgi:hypothetical protein